MRYPVLFVCVCLLVACGGKTTTAMTAPGSSPLPAESVQFDDLNGIYERRYIIDLARLRVFEQTTGSFHPADPITRGEYVRWLINANNAIWWDDPNHQVRLAEGPPATFPDVSVTDPNFKYIQGVDNAGIAIGFGDKYFHPNAPLTHEQLLAIKESLDRGGSDSSLARLTGHSGPLSDSDRIFIPQWKDADRIQAQFRPLIATLNNDDRFNRDAPDKRFDTIGRTFGPIAMLRPAMPVTRAQAAASLWKIGAHASPIEKSPRTAAEAIAAYDVTPSPSASPQ